jgi:hypothetical protein
MIENLQSVYRSGSSPLRCSRKGSGYDGTLLLTAGVRQIVLLRYYTVSQELFLICSMP